MQLEAYLLLSIQHECYKRRAWFFSVFSVTKETEEQAADVYPGKLIREPYGFSVVLPTGEKEKLETDRKPDAPLLNVSERLTIDHRYVSSILAGQKIETSIGTLLVNLICIHGPFKGKFPYKTGNFTPKDVEKEIASKLLSNPKPNEPRLDTAYYVDEQIEYAQGVSYLETLSVLFSHSVTKIGLMPAPGRQKFKADVLKRYEGKLQDPVEFAKFEAELGGFDKEYLKADPAYGKFMSGKVLNSRMASFMTQGGQANNFSEQLSVTPVVQSLEDGIPLDKEGFTAISNTIRYGSFSRGAETVNGGVVAKALMRAADNWRITKGDCGTKLGSRRLYKGNAVSDLKGRYLVLGNQVKLVETVEEAKSYINQKIVIRSPQYCRRPGGQTCEICAGVALSKYPTGLAIPLMEVSGGILNDSLKKMHNSKLRTVTADLTLLIT